MIQLLLESIKVINILATYGGKGIFPDQIVEAVILTPRHHLFQSEYRGTAFEVSGSQGDHIGLVFANWAIVYNRQIENYRSSPNCWATFSSVKVVD
jgi:hypothetical protein